MTQSVFRFAPSPNGRLHLGHAYSALLNQAFARRWGGRFLLRIEDIDVTRCRPELDLALQDDLAWLGLSWERPVRRQSEHLGTYRAVFDGLRTRGLLFPCFCSRGSIAGRVAGWEARDMRAWPRDPDGTPRYPGTCRQLDPDQSRARIAAGEAHCWRLDMAAALTAAPSPYEFSAFAEDGAIRIVEAHPERWGDAIIVRKEIGTSYHLSVVVDDAVQGVTHVVRGTDLEAATDLHVLLQRLIGCATPRYHHHGLLLDQAGDKLSKSRRSESLADLRARGVTPGAIRERLGFLS